MGDRPKRIQRRRTRGWRMPDGATYVGRPTRWGNPYYIGDGIDISGHQWGDVGAYDPDRPISFQNSHTIQMTAAMAVELYRTELLGNLRDDDPHFDELRAALTDLAGRDLCCWCPLDRPCHADVLLGIANG